MQRASAAPLGERWALKHRFSEPLTSIAQLEVSTEAVALADQALQSRAIRTTCRGVVFQQHPPHLSIGRCHGRAPAESVLQRVL